MEIQCRVHLWTRSNCRRNMISSTTYTLFASVIEDSSGTFCGMQFRIHALTSIVIQLTFHPTILQLFAHVLNSMPVYVITENKLW